jgi:MFS family permease
MAGCLLVLSGMQSLWQLYVFYSLGRALAVGALQVAAAVAVSNWFIRRRGFTLAIGNAGSRVGMATLPVMTAVVIGTAGDWRVGWVALAVVIVVVGVAPPMLLLQQRPEDRGLRPDGDGAPLVTGAATAFEAEPAWSLREALRTRAYWLIGGAIAVVLFGSGSVNFHTIPHLQDQGLSRTTAALIVTVYSLTSAVGGLLGGMLAMRWRARRTLMWSLVVMAAGIMVLLVADSVALAMVFAITFGLSFGSFVTLSQVIYADYFGRRSMGAIYGSSQPVQLTFNALGPYVAGVWFDHAGTYVVPFTAFALLFLLGAAGLMASSRPAAKNFG